MFDANLIIYRRYVIKAQNISIKLGSFKVSVSFYFKEPSEVSSLLYYNFTYMLYEIYFLYLGEEKGIPNVSFLSGERWNLAHTGGDTHRLRSTLYI